MDKNRFNREVRSLLSAIPIGTQGVAFDRLDLDTCADDYRAGKTWLETAPKIKLFPIKDARSPYPLSREEQALLFQELPDHLARMALFKVNTGLREQEVCRLKWEYEVNVAELETSVFIIPGEQVKNGEERLVVLNRVAKSVIDP
jgi:integrase